MKEERDNIWGGGGLPTLPSLYLSTFQPSQQGFFRVHTFVWREREPEPEFSNFSGPHQFHGIGRLVLNSIADPGSRIRCLFDLWIRDPGWIKSGSRSGIWNEQPGSYFLELINHFLGLKYSKFSDAIRDSDPGWKKFRSGNRDQG